MVRMSTGKAALAALALLVSVQVIAGEENRPQRGQFNPEEFRARMMERMKENLGLNDEEMKALQPKIEAVQKAQGNARIAGGFGGGFGGGRRRGGNEGGNTAAPTPPPLPENATDMQKKSRELTDLLANKEADPAAVKAKLAEVREIRDKGRVELKKAQDELRELVTPKQEAQLVMMGLLE